MTGIGTAEQGRRLPWADVLLSAIASVSWALIGMAGTAALGLHLLQADTAGSLGPMTAAVVALGAGGSVTPSGDVSAFGLKGAEATTALQITPLGVSLVGALLMSWFFLRSLRAAGVGVTPGELLARAGLLVTLFVALLGFLAWAGHDTVTLDGGSLGLDRLPGKGGGGIDLPGLGDIGGLLPGHVGDLVHAEAAVGFTVDTGPTLLGGAVWAAGVLVIALLASRRTPLPSGWDALHRVVRPAVSALVAVLLVAVAAGLAAAAYAALRDDHPARIAGAALLGAPNGVWLGVPLGLFVPWDGRATGELAKLLPDPLDRLLRTGTDQPLTVGRLADLDGRVWLLALAAVLAMLCAGVLTAARTPVVRGFVGHCALRLGIVTAAALPLLAWLTEVSVNASLSVLGFDAFGAGIDLHGHLGTAVLLGAAWGAAAGAAGALLAYAMGAAGSRAAPLAGGGGGQATSGWSGPGQSAPGQAGAGPYGPGRPHRPPNPDTNPYLRLPEELRETSGAAGGSPGAGAPPQAGGPPGTGTPPRPDRSPGAGAPPGSGGPPEVTDVHGAPTMVGPIEPPVRRRRGASASWGEGPPPPPPPPPARGGG
ncbi:streptophobe family protein [Streptomyces sp. RY43-2]|uniref:Streptophobe family protein n=1 Tax=Streptomyces macrolidinus TaxID=2952607 RepID=A0ABT0ZLX1_9ACTN|nr:streptophobe family protein [Streptomyces macrolidinus]MCN9244593.1 streptophobe family protein [Streptomyces macrolidinus]